MIRRLRDEKDARILHLEELVKEIMRRYKAGWEPGIKRPELDQAGLPDPAPVKPPLVGSGTRHLRQYPYYGMSRI